MSKICPMYSSSKGNCTYIKGAGTGILVDAGVSYSRIRAGLASQNVDIADIRAVLVTHEHSDHIKGLALLLKKHPIQLIASTGTLAHLCETGVVSAHTELVDCCPGPVQAGDIEVHSFPTPHDAVHSVGYQLNMPDGRKIAVATDLGHITAVVRENITGCDLVMLESNYDGGMLDCSAYPYYLKRRIKSDYGHLENEVCAAEIAALVRMGSTRFILAHLSEQNNAPQIAHVTSQSALFAEGMRENMDYTLHVAPAHGPREAFVF